MQVGFGLFWAFGRPFGRGRTKLFGARSDSEIPSIGSGTKHVAPPREEAGPEEAGHEGHEGREGPGHEERARLGRILHPAQGGDVTNSFDFSAVDRRRQHDDDSGVASGLCFRSGDLGGRLFRDVGLKRAKLVLSLGARSIRCLARPTKETHPTLGRNLRPKLATKSGVFRRPQVTNMC